MACLAGVLFTGRAAAQTPGADPNPGAMTLAVGMDASNIYLFRGIPQDDTGVMLWPSATLSVALVSGQGAFKALTLDVGTWNSLHTGVTGSDGPSGKLWYESDFSAGVGFVFGHGVSLATTYTAYTSPNNAFATVREVSLRAGVQAYGVAPYALVAFELEGQADGGHTAGRYLEVGAAPSVRVAGAAVSAPVRLGVSLDGYYEGLRGDERFGFVSVGGAIQVPLSGGTSRLGRWSAHGGAEYVRLGDSNALRLGDNSRVVVSAGIGLTY
jgi:hypothetical protein